MSLAVLAAFCNVAVDKWEYLSEVLLDEVQKASAADASATVPTHLLKQLKQLKSRSK